MKFASEKRDDFSDKNFIAILLKLPRIGNDGKSTLNSSY